MTNIDDEYQNLKQMMDDIKAIYLANTSLAKEEMEVRIGMRPHILGLGLGLGLRVKG